MNDSIDEIIEVLTNNHPTAADGRSNLAHYTTQVVADLNTPQALRKMLAAGEVELTRSGGIEGYDLTLKGRLAACRATIETVVREMRQIMAEMDRTAALKTRRARRTRKAA